MKNNNKGLYVIVAILLILVIVLGGYIVYDKVNNKDGLEDKNQNVNNNDNNTPVSYDNWMDYLLSTDISSINIEQCVLTNEEVGWERNDIKITKDDLSKIFNEMKKGTISKYYYGGYGGSCISSIVIVYKADNTNYKLNLVEYYKIDSGQEYIDPKVLSYLEKSNYTIKKWSEDIDMDHEPYSFDYNYNTEIVDDIISKYAK